MAESLLCKMYCCRIDGLSYTNRDDAALHLRFAHGIGRYDRILMHERILIGDSAVFED